LVFIEGTFALNNETKLNESKANLINATAGPGDRQTGNL